MAELKDFAEGQSVIYCPMHANGDLKHKDCERGYVTSVNTKFVFVRFPKSPSCSQACDPTDLHLVHTTKAL